jgi:hypothetical protein
MIPRLIAVLLMLSSAASAADSPRFLPDRDAAVTYATTGSDAAVPPSITIRYFSAGDRLRIEGGAIGFLLVDRVMERVELVMPQPRLVWELPPGGGITDGFILGPQLRFTRMGPSKVLGRACTVYNVAADRATGQVCLTPEGLLLRGEGRGRDGRVARIEATAVSFQTQPAGLFSPPDGARVLAMPQ